MEDERKKCRREEITRKEEESEATNCSHFSGILKNYESILWGFCVLLYDHKYFFSFVTFI